MVYQVRLVGEGGQGLILGGVILAEAAGIYEGKNVIQSQIYGAAARGEISKSEVIISDKTIYYPKVRHADTFLALTQDAYDTYKDSVKEDGIIIIDSFYVKDYNPGWRKTYPLPLSETAIDVVGKEIATNIVSLAAIDAITNVVKKDSLKKAVLSRVPKGTEDANLKAFEAGYKLGEGV